MKTEPFKIKVLIQTTIDRTYDLIAAENKHGYKLGDFIKTVQIQPKQNRIGIASCTCEAKEQKTIF